MTKFIDLTLNGISKGRQLNSTAVIALAKPIVTTIWSHGIYSNNGFTCRCSANIPAYPSTHG